MASFFRWILVIGGGIGGGFMFLGFYFWYSRVQKYLDIKLKKEVNSIKIIKRYYHKRQE